MKFRKNKKGFTLVELVVVIAILAILASVATVATVTVLNNARKTPVQDTLNTLKSQVAMYQSDIGYSTSWRNTGSGKSEKKGLASFLGDNIKDVTIVEAANKTYNQKPTDGKLVIWCDTANGLKEASGGASKDTTFTLSVGNEYYKGSITFNPDGSTVMSDIVEW